MKRHTILVILTLWSISIYGQQLDNTTKDSLRIVICNMLSDDQKHRTIDVVGKGQQELDSINFYKLITITEKFGYPDNSRIGDNGCNVNPFIILLHNPDRLIQTENYKLFINECKKGNISGWELGQALDRYYFHYYKKSMYGCYGGKPCIDDIETVNKNRKDLGLKELKTDEFKTCR